MHSNAAITSAIIETNAVCNTVLSLLPRSAGKKGVSPEVIIKEKIQTLLKELPQLFQEDDVARKYKIIREESMNTVLQQELIR